MRDDDRSRLVVAAPAPRDSDRDWPKDNRGNKLPERTLYYSLDGELLCRLTADRSYKPDPLRTVELMPSLKNDIARHRYLDEVTRYYDYLNVVRKYAPNRTVPVTRNEFIENVVGKKALRELCNAQILKEALIDIISTTAKQSAGKRAIVYFTPQGRAFVREYINPTYALTDNI